jgi:hypothetical protein
MSESDSSPLDIDNEQLHISGIDGPHGPLDDDGNATLTLTLSNNMEIDVYVKEIRTKEM